MRIAIVVCLLFLFWVPISIVAYGALAGATGTAMALRRNPPPDPPTGHTSRMNRQKIRPYALAVLGIFALAGAITAAFLAWFP
jgi:hypothetical protein